MEMSRGFLIRQLRVLPLWDIERHPKIFETPKRTYSTLRIASSRTREGHRLFTSASLHSVTLRASLFWILPFFILRTAFDNKATA